MDIALSGLIKVASLASVAAVVHTLAGMLAIRAGVADNLNSSLYYYIKCSNNLDIIELDPSIHV